MNEERRADRSPAHPNREAALEAENARLRAALARAGLDGDHALAQAKVAQQEARQARDAAVDAAAGHTQEMGEGRAKLSEVEALNQELSQANAALVASQAALAASEARLRNALAIRTVGVMFWGPGFGLTEANDAFLDMIGFTREEALGLTWQDLTPEEFYPASLRAVEEVTTRGETTPFEKQYYRKDGSRWWGLFAARKVGDEVVEFVLDVTARREAEEALRESEAALRRLNESLEAQVEARTSELRQALDALHAEALERMQAEEALRQAQKMEAVGQLTGGIAHDFNNMLQAIAGSLELMQKRIAQGRTAEAGRFVDAANQTVERAAALTHRLLAFARRQALHPKPVNSDALAEGMADLIRRTVGPAVRVELHLGDGSWPVQCDPNQLENVLLNLAINARDAMPEGGRLTIGTRHVCLSAADVAHQEGARAGDYVEITVTDTGTGMDEVTRTHAFDPFFTTKPLGEGTGLGLSQVYGFVRQSYGVVHLDSAPGQGTTVRFCLPRHGRSGGDAGKPELQSAITLPAGGTGGGTVLLVEDEESVRAVAAEHLRDLGYEVLEATDGPSALRLLQGGDLSLDLLVTDVGLPNGLNGRQVADTAREHRPDLPVLLITGYAGSALERQLVPGMAVMNKPFALDAFAIKVQEMIGRVG